MRVCGILYLLIAFTFIEQVFTQDSINHRTNRGFLNDLHPSWSFNRQNTPEQGTASYNEGGITHYFQGSGAMIRREPRLFILKDGGNLRETLSVDIIKPRGKHTNYVKLNNRGRPESITKCKKTRYKKYNCITLDHEVCNILNTDLRPVEHAIRDCIAYYQNPGVREDLPSGPERTLKNCQQIHTNINSSITIMSKHYTNLQQMRVLAAHNATFIQDRYFNPLIGRAFPNGPAEIFNNFSAELTLCSKNAFQQEERDPFTAPQVTPVPASRLHFGPVRTR